MLNLIHYAIEIICTAFILWLVIRAWSKQWDKGRTTTRTAIIFTVAGACLIAGIFTTVRLWSVLCWVVGAVLILWIWFEALMIRRLVRKHLRGRPDKVGKLTYWLFRDFFEPNHGK